MKYEEVVRRAGLSEFAIKFAHTTDVMIQKQLEVSTRLRDHVARYSSQLDSPHRGGFSPLLLLEIQSYSNDVSTRGAVLRDRYETLQGIARAEMKLERFLAVISIVEQEELAQQVGEV